MDLSSYVVIIPEDIQTINLEIWMNEEDINAAKSLYTNYTELE